MLLGLLGSAKAGRHPDYQIIAVVFILVIFGLVMLASASSELGAQNFGDTFYYLKRQLLLGLLPGLFFFAVLSKIYYRKYQRFAIVFLIASLALFSLVFTDLGIRAGGAGRWLRIGPIQFQPAEFIKITFILYLAAWLANPKKKRDKNFLEGFVPFLIITGIIAALLIAQPATSTVAILMGAGLVVYFVSGAPFRFIALAVLCGLLSLAAVIVTSGYRINRILGFLNPGGDTEDLGYHLGRALTTIGSGGLWGAGYGQSLIKAGRLPASINDSIFAIIGSELGFVGASILVALFAFLTIRIFYLAIRMRDGFGRLILIGFGTIVGAQAFVNMASISGLIPLTGIPLPFISYGGTAFVVFLAMSGIVVNISKYT